MEFEQLMLKLIWKNDNSQNNFVKEELGFILILYIYIYSIIKLQ